MGNSKIKKMLFNIFRKQAMKAVTNNLGPVEEKDGKLFCYVKQSKVKKKDYNYSIYLEGLKEDEKIANIYNLDKPICYVFDGLKFGENRVYIYSDEYCEVVIRNCEFGFWVNLHSNGKCTLENAGIKSFSSSLCLSANELTLKNISIKRFFDELIYISIGGVKKLNIINSNIGDLKGRVLLGSEGIINLENTKISGSLIELKTKEITADENTKISARQKVVLDDVCDFDKINIQSPKIIYNGNEISTNEETVVFEKLKEPLEIKRIVLIDSLKKVLDKCEENNIIDANRYIDSLNEKTISKVLK